MVLLARCSSEQPSADFPWDYRQQEMLLLQNFEAATRKFEMQKLRLEEQLTQERRLRREIETKAEEQISRLEAEISGLREWKMDSSEAYFARSVRAHVPSPQPQVPTQASQHQFSLVETGTGNNRPRTSDRENKARALTLDLLKQMMETASTMFNGSSAEEQEQLDAATREHLQNYHRDLTQAKIEIFGYEISEEEIEDIPEPERKEVRKKLEAVIRRGTEARYRAQLAVRRS
ncbi:UNVERIFIED_CONTAM: hypothetical protein K2H54_032158 [Gekko kuhli]